MAEVRLKLLPVEKATLYYAGITAVYMCVFAGRIDALWMHFGVRAAVVIAIILLARLSHREKAVSLRPAINTVRYVLPFAMLSYWYPETSCYNECIFSNLDRHFVAADEILFGCQPSLVFSDRLPQAWMSELMYFGYFSYYFIFFGTALWCYVRRKDLADKAAFIFVGSFYCYYLIFIVFPVTGPQFYFEPPFSEAPDGYLFCDIMRFLQAIAEKPTGAFPSSHVGIAFAVVIFVSRHCRRLFPYVLPLFVVLVCSTVYIKAHYVVDIIAGFASVAMIYPLMDKMWKIAKCR
jgi:membrane-associated phospholipid phosphatase